MEARYYGCQLYFAAHVCGMELKFDISRIGVISTFNALWAPDVGVGPEASASLTSRLKRHWFLSRHVNAAAYTNSFIAVSSKIRWNVRVNRWLAINWPQSKKWIVIGWAASSGFISYVQLPRSRSIAIGIPFFLVDHRLPTSVFPSVFRATPTRYAKCKQFQIESNSFVDNMNLARIPCRIQISSLIKIKIPY